MSNVNHPQHYNQYKFEAIEILRYLSFDAGNCIKYIVRAPFKGNESEDLQKALWYASDFTEYFSTKNVRYVSKKKFEKLSRKVDYFTEVIRNSKIPASHDFATLVNVIWKNSVKIELRRKLVLFEKEESKQEKKHVKRELKQCIEIVRKSMKIV